MKQQFVRHWISGYGGQWSLKDVNQMRYIIQLSSLLPLGSLQAAMQGGGKQSPAESLISWHRCKFKETKKKEKSSRMKKAFSFHLPPPQMSFSLFKKINRLGLFSPWGIIWWLRDTNYEPTNLHGGISLKTLFQSFHFCFFFFF